MITHRRKRASRSRRRHSVRDIRRQRRLDAHTASAPDAPGALGVAEALGPEAFPITAESETIALPPRYGMIVLGSGLLMLASAASVPLGPAATTAGRELLTFLAAAAGILFLIRASMPVPVPRIWSRWFVRLRGGALALALLLAGGTLLTFAGGAYTALHAPVAQSYVTDIVSLTHEDAALMLAGRNPYTSDDGFRAALERFPLALGTPLRGSVFGTGYTHPLPARIAAVQQQYVRSPASAPDAFDPATLHSYPALSFLIYVPFLWAGFQNTLMLHMLIYWAMFAWLVWLTPVGWRHWGALVALAAMPTMASSLIVSNEIIAIALVLTAWHFRKQPWLFALLLGLACSYKQYAWFFVPFFAAEVLLAYGWREALRRGILVLGAFLVPNLPFLIASPREWFASLWLPMSEPLFATGMGIITLPIGSMLPYGAPLVYALLELVAMAALLWVYARWRVRVGDAILLLALVPLFFAFRSPPTYFAFMPWLALYAANQLYARIASPPPSRLALVGEATLMTLGRHLRTMRDEVNIRLSRYGEAGASVPVKSSKPGQGARPETARDTPSEMAVSGPEPRHWPSYYPTGWSVADHALDVVDRLTGGQAEWFQRLFSFLVVGGIGTVVNLAVFSLLYYQTGFGSDDRARWLVAFLAATEVSILANFALNDYFTFRHLPGYHRTWRARCARFHVTAIGGVLVTLVISGTLHALGVAAVVAQAIAILLATAVNFVVHHLYTYRPLHHHPPAE